jgi:L-threonylcarbamoyladenylate synthase
MTDVLAPTDEGLARAAELLRAGGLVAFPTDTVYGVGCAASHPEAVADLFALKRRPVDRLIPQLVTGIDDIPAERWQVDDRSEALAQAFWPGALTLVIRSRAADLTQAFRAPDHPVALALIRAAGPLYASSANISDEPETLDADDVLIAFATQGDGLAAVVNGGRVPGGVASTVLDLTTDPPRIVRAGPVTPDMLREVVAVEPASID